MKTLTVDEARAKLPSLIKRVKRGEEIGILAGDKVIHLKPTELVPWEDSYLYQEYGVTPEEWERFKKRTQARRIKEKYVECKGKFDAKSFE